MKKFFSALIAAVMMLSGLTVLVNAESGGLPVDVAIVIDDTRSMNDNDPDRLASEAVKKLAAKLFPNDNIHIGLATYDLDVGSNCLELGSYSKEQVEAFADTIVRDGRGTDAASGLSWAVNQMKNKGRVNAKHAIILVGDGENSYVREGVQVRTDADSNAVLEEAKNIIRDNGYEVYTLAINPTSDRFRQYFKDIATAAENSKEPNSQTLDEDIQKIVDSITGISGDNGGRIIPPKEKVEVPKEIEENTFQMNVQVDHEGKLDIKLSDPDGNIINADNQTGILTQGDSYTNFKVLRPKKGIWKITFVNLDDTEQNVKWNITTMSDLAMTTDIDDETGMASMQLLLGSQPVEDRAALSQVNAKIYAKENGGSEETVFEALPEGNVFKAKLNLDESKEYKLRFVFDVGGATIESTQDFKPGGAEPVPTPTPDGINGNGENGRKSRNIIWIICACAAAAALAAVVAVLIKKKLDKTPVPFTPDIKVKMNCEAQSEKYSFNEREFNNIGLIFMSLGTSNLRTLMDNYRSYCQKLIGDMASGREKLEASFTSSFSEAAERVRLFDTKDGKHWIEFTAPSNDSWTTAEYTLNDVKVTKYPTRIRVMMEEDYTIKMNVGEDNSYTIRLVFSDSNSSSDSFVF